MIRIKYFFFLLMLFCFCQKDLVGQNQTQRNIDSLNNILKIAKEDTVKIKTLNNLSRQYINAGRSEEGMKYANKALDLANQILSSVGNEKIVIIKMKNQIAAAYHNIAVLNDNQGNYSEALKKNMASLEIFEEIGDKRGIGASFNNIGRVYANQGNYLEALKNYIASQKIMEEIGDKVGIGISYNNIGTIYDIQGNYTEALKNYQASLKIKEEIGDKRGVAVTYDNVGVIYSHQKNYQQSLKNAQAFLKISEEIGDKYLIVAAYTSIGTDYNNLENYPTALKNFFISLKIAEEIGDKKGMSLNYYSIGDTYLAQKNYRKALANLSESLKVAEEIEVSENLADAFIKKGEALSKLATTENPPDSKAKYVESIHYLNKGLSLAVEIDYKEGVVDAYNTFSETYKGMNDYKKALEYYNLYVEMKDSLMNNETTRKLEQQRTQYEVEKAVAEEKVQHETVLAAQKAYRKRKNELLMAGLGILAIVSIFFGVLIRQRNQKRRAVEKAEAGHKMAELELQSLRAQLNPHFMFNSLNAIQDLILKEDNDRSHLYLSRFAKLLRILLDNANQPFVSVKQELEFLELYLSLENLRIPNLQFSIEKDPKINTEERMVPNMMLQPYIENAIWHGLSNKKGERKLQVRIHENSNAIEFEIEDNGVGRKKATEIKEQYRKEHHSKGMELLSKRFNLLSSEYGEAINTSVIDLEDNGNATGTLVKINVPLTLSEQAKRLVHDTNHHN